MPEPLPIVVTVNGRRYAEDVIPRLHLADFLRHQLGLTGTHVGCEQGVCGNCTVLVDGRPVKSCLMLAVQADQTSIDTIEGLADGSSLSDLQICFKEEHGLQCGFCTPGFLMTVTALAERVTEIDEAQLREEIAGVLCRCTGYDGAVAATRRYLTSRGVPVRA